jgi:hypothetical protein
MHRVCSWCKKNLGERCPHCGSTHVARLFATLHSAPPVVGCRRVQTAMWECSDCRKTWMDGEDGVTHGLCPSCYGTMKAAIPAA